MHKTLNIDENKKLIIHFICKSRDEFFKPSYFMVAQCLSNKNKSDTVSKPKKKRSKQGLTCLVVPQPKFFHLSHQIFGHMHRTLNVYENKN